MKKWEYLTDSMSDRSSYSVDFDKLGLEGWELVAVIYDDGWEKFYFKREII